MNFLALDLSLSLPNEKAMIVNGCKNKSLIKSFVYFPILPFGFVHRVKHIDKYFPTFIHAERLRILCRIQSNLFLDHWFYLKRMKWASDSFEAYYYSNYSCPRYFRKIIIQSHSRNKAGARIKKIERWNKTHRTSTSSFSHSFWYFYFVNLKCYCSLLSKASTFYNLHFSNKFRFSTFSCATKGNC